MSAAEALQMARAAGIHLRLDGDDLLLEAAAPPSPAILGQISRNKLGIMARLWPDRDGWSAADWQSFFDERAGIVEFDAGMSRARAEAEAFESCVQAWLCRKLGDVILVHPLTGQAGDPTGSFSQNTLAQKAALRAEAIAAMADMGIHAGKREK